MRVIAIGCAALLTGCGAVYSAQPGINDADSVAFHNALGERRYCTSPTPPSAGMTALYVLGGGIGCALAASGPVLRAQYEDCAGSLRTAGYVLTTETPTVTADELLARRAQQAAADAADSDRRNAMR